MLVDTINTLPSTTATLEAAVSALLKTVEFVILFISQKKIRSHTFRSALLSAVINATATALSGIVTCLGSQLVAALNAATTYTGKASALAQIGLHLVLAACGQV